MSFDDLRNDATSKPFYDENEAEYHAAAGTGGSSRRSSRFLGMTSVQRFVLVFLLMIATCVIGSLCLLLTGRIAF